PVMVATVLWGSLFSIFNEYDAGLVSFGYFVITLGSVIIMHYTRQIHYFISLQLSMGLLLPFSETLMLGGIKTSGAVILWSFLSPLAATIFYKPPKAIFWWFANFLFIIAAVILPPYLHQESRLPPGLVDFFFIINISGVSLIVFLILGYFIAQKDEAFRLLRIEQEKGESLLLNILPKEIAAILKNEKRSIADHFAGASILFADLVGFTPLTAKMAPIEMVDLLNEIFSHFDELVEKYELEKIRTIGDSYMVAAGVPRVRQDHAHAIVHMALEMRDYIVNLPPVEGKPVAFRIGINSGPVVGGVIGRKKFVYDLWGDAVNVASRMESHGIANEIQITQATYEIIQQAFHCIPRGTIEIKGRGAMATWLVIKSRLPKES
ncbi:MAG: adenylate/guanylate cyclase domain-containing protein, partial [Anaerolineaceae bacterium]